ncbi:hypothetical protein HPG69_011303 [Diceros bicornis minor]|uniref:Coiled-coil SMC6 And NSE5 INteracting (CANIN) domain-containing protein n=1 Tax=Diceros bicornis minor TaxID=77932 RepID=A0A7J7FDZ0_DICBM|nr:hypothetical protein HPG69_011303 [Diceros bicornis minor]
MVHVLGLWGGAGGRIPSSALVGQALPSGEPRASSGGFSHLTGHSFQDKTSSGLQMARPQKTVQALPRREAAPPPHPAPLQSRLSSRSQIIEEAQDAGNRGHSCVGTVGPQGLRRLACQLPEELQQEPQDSDHRGRLASLGGLFWNMAGPRQKAAAPVVDTRTSFASGGSESYINSLEYLLQEKREQALEQEREKLLLQGCPDLNSVDLNEDEASLTPEHRMLVERFSMSLQVIPPVHPGETVFLPRRHPLPCILDCSHLKPRSHLEGLFLSSPPAQQLSFLRSGLLSNLYLHIRDCPVPLLQWLFQLLTWPPETSSGAFGLLWDLSVDGLFCQSGQY